MITSKFQYAYRLSYGVKRDTDVAIQNQYAGALCVAVLSCAHVDRPLWDLTLRADL